MGEARRNILKGSDGVKNRQRGLTLIELMLSFGILALVVVSSFYTLMIAHQMSEDSRYRLLALNAARSVLEEVKITPLANVRGIVTANFVPNNLPRGAITITTNPVVLTGAQVATVTITVTWRGAANKRGQLEITTMRSRY
jgi:Tfp pilus assembly protein PilX